MSSPEVKAAMSRPSPTASASTDASPTLFTVTIDTEEEWDWNAGWPTHDYSVRNIRQLPRFQALCSRYNIATTYFTDLAVLEDPAARAIMLDLSSEPRVEIGMHIHPWNTPPLDGAAPSTARSSFIHNLRPNLIRAKLETVYQRFEELGLRPTSFRGGRYSSGPVTQQFLYDKGFWADASVLPYTSWPDDGAPDYRDRDLLPQRVSEKGVGNLLPDRPGGCCAQKVPDPFFSTNLLPHRPGGCCAQKVPDRFLPPHALWEVPLTLAFTRNPQTFWRRTYEWVERSWIRKLRVIGIGERLGLVRKVWLNFESPLGCQMLPFLRKLRGMKLPCITFTVHSSSLVAGLNPFTPTADDEARLFDQVEEVFDALSHDEAFQSATMTEVAQSLEQEFQNEQTGRAHVASSPDYR